jgi:putative DNA primase/helicase
VNKPAELHESDIVDQFRAAMASVGLRTDDKLEADGDINRFHIDGDPPRTKNGWYVLHVDNIPAGAFGCWKRGIESSWCAKAEAELTSVERAEINARIERARAEREERQRQMHAAVADEARRMWDGAAECDTHPYLERKGVKSYGLRTAQWMNGNQAMLVPIIDASGQIVSLQAIFGNVNPVIGRDKDFLAGGKKRGCWFSIGTPPPAGNGIVVLCEGYATGASVFEATGHFTVCTFDAGNIKPVAHELRRRWPAATILVAADNDRWTVPTAENPHIVGNPGVTYARQTAEAIPARVLVAIPEFADLDGNPTDFNDLHQREGIYAVRAQINAVLPKPEPANDNTPQPKHLALDAAVNPFGFPHLSDKGQPINTVENLEYVIGEYGITARYNEVRKQVELNIPGRRGRTLDNRANVALAELNSICARNRMPQSMLADYVKVLADRNTYNPVCDWIKSKPWDGTPRIQALLDTVTVDGDATLKNKLIYRWLLSAVSALFKPFGFTSHGVLVFTGPQGQGKTSWVKALVPEDMGVVLEGATLDPNNKDTVVNAVSHWLVELGELDATFRKSDIARLKSFVTQAVDKLRRPYDRVESEYQRRTVFFASVNEGRYLVDTSGNRRWWTVPVLSVNYRHTIDVQQVWAELLTHFERGEQHWLLDDEQKGVNDLNTDHEAVDPVEEMIAAHFDWQALAGIGYRDMTASEVLSEIGYDKPNKAQATHCSTVLKKLTGADSRKTGSRRVFKMPPVARKSRGFGDDSPI